MKILTQDEIDAHRYATAVGGLKGAAVGFAITAGIFKLGARKWPGFPKNLTWSLRTLIFIAPPTVACSIMAEEASNAFDRQMYSSETEAKRKLEEHQRWAKLPLSEKITNGAINNKYKIIVGAWAASMYGSWVLVDRDPIMTKTQKLVQARMYAQGITVILLLAAMGVSMWDEEAHPEHYQKNEKEDWVKVLELEAEKDKEQKAVKAERLNIYK